MSDIDSNELIDGESGSGNIVVDIVLKMASTVVVSTILGTISYLIGNNNGYKKGFKDASKIYEKKLKKQTEEFLTGKKKLEANLEELNKLIDTYESYIGELEERLAEGENVGDVIDFLKAKEEELDNLRDA